MCGPAVHFAKTWRVVISKMRKTTPGNPVAHMLVSIRSGGGGGNNKWDRRSWRLRRRAAATSIGRQKWLSFKKDSIISRGLPTSIFVWKDEPTALLQEICDSVLHADCRDYDYYLHGHGHFPVKWRIKMRQQQAYLESWVASFQRWDETLKSW